MNDGTTLTSKERLMVREYTRKAEYCSDLEQEYNKRKSYLKRIAKRMSYLGDIMRNISTWDLPAEVLKQSLPAQTMYTASIIKQQCNL